MTADEWNAQYPVGTRVRYWPIRGASDNYSDSRTRSAAWELDSGISIVSIEGRSGGVALSHLMALEDERDPSPICDAGGLQHGRIEPMKTNPELVDEAIARAKADPNCGRVTKEHLDKSQRFVETVSKLCKEAEMGKDEVAKALNIVAKLNEELDTQDYVESSFWAETNGEEVFVKLHINSVGDVSLWDSFEDGRPWSDDLDEPEDLEARLRRRAKEVFFEVVEQAKYVKL